MDIGTNACTATTDSESCGYRMLYNMNEVCNQRNIESIANEEMALEGYIH